MEDQKKKDAEELEKIYLPEVEGRLVDPPNVAGKWENKRDLLRNLADDLPGGDRGSSTSIPSTWARALVFDEALANTRHPQHEDIKNEWRGLMGVFCFRECFGLRLNFTNLNFNPPTDRLTNSLLIQKPDGWPDQIYLVKVDGLLIGGSSPGTLFFTPPEYECSNFVPWYENGRLYDPLKYFDNLYFDKEKKILKTWIERTIDHLQGEVGASVIQPFHEWLREMANIELDPSADFESSDEGLPLPYDFVNLYFSWENQENSDFLLKVSRAVERPPIVVWKRDWNQEGKRVFNSWHYLNFVEGNDVPDEPFGEYLSGGRVPYPWIRPERLFLTDQILRLPLIDKNQIPVYGNDTADRFKEEHVPPLKGEILRYLSPEDLRGRLNMEDAEGGGIKVTLTLPLTSGRSLNIFKTYNQEQIINILEPDLRPFEVWPDFKRVGWHRYYCIYGKIENLDLKPWVYNPRQDGIRMHRVMLEIPNRPMEIKFIWELSSFPEAVLCSYNGEEVGIILLNSPREARSFNIEWDVVIDLGTVNTVVFFRQGRQKNPVEFKDHCVQIIKTPEAYRELFLNMFFFFPKTYLGGFFATSFIKLTPADVLKPVVDGKASLGSSRDWFSWMEQEPFLLDLLREDLKWSRDKDEINCLYAYLKYLILMICTEAAHKGVHRMNLKWSYPSAFSEEMRISLRAAFTSLPDWVRRTQNAINVTIDERDRQGETESVAVCRHLSSIEESIMPRAIADIGGGTTDIGIWQEDQMISQTSILLAGRVLTDYIGSREDLRKNILLVLNMPTEGVTFDYFTKRCAHCFNNLVNDRHDELYPLFTIIKKIDEEVGYKQVRSIIFLIFAGITYYIGLILKQIKTPPIGIWLAGNGSKLINLVDPEALSFLKRFLPTEIDVKPAVPHHTKQEVARGILSDVIFTTSVHPKVMIGEDGYKFEGREVQFSQEVTLDNIISDEIEPPKDYPQLSQFLKVYNECASNLELVSLKTTNDLNLRIQQAMQGKIAYLKNMAQNHIRRDKPYQGLIQPFFVEELKFLIKEAF